MSTYESTTYDQVNEYVEDGEEQNPHKVLAEELYNLKKDGFDVL